MAACATFGPGPLSVCLFGCVFLVLFGAFCVSVFVFVLLWGLLWCSGALFCLFLVLFFARFGSFWARVVFVCFAFGFFLFVFVFLCVLVLFVFWGSLCVFVGALVVLWGSSVFVLGVCLRGSLLGLWFLLLLRLGFPFRFCLFVRLGSFCVVFVLFAFLWGLLWCSGALFVFVFVVLPPCSRFGVAERRLVGLGGRPTFALVGARPTPFPLFVFLFLVLLRSFCGFAVSVLFVFVFGFCGCLSHVHRGGWLLASGFRKFSQQQVAKLHRLPSNMKSKLYELSSKATNVGFMVG